MFWAMEHTANGNEDLVDSFDGRFAEQVYDSANYFGKKTKSLEGQLKDWFD